MSDPSAVPATTPTQPVSPRGRFFTNQTFHFETLRNAGYIFSQSADMGEILANVGYSYQRDSPDGIGARYASSSKPPMFGKYEIPLPAP